MLNFNHESSLFEIDPDSFYIDSIPLSDFSETYGMSKILSEGLEESKRSMEDILKEFKRVGGKISKVNRRKKG